MLWFVTLSSNFRPYAQNSPSCLARNCLCSLLFCCINVPSSPTIYTGRLTKSCSIKFTYMEEKKNLNEENTEKKEKLDKPGLPPQPCWALTLGQRQGGTVARYRHRDSWATLDSHARHWEAQSSLTGIDTKPLASCMPIKDPSRSRNTASWSPTTATDGPPSCSLPSITPPLSTCNYCLKTTAPTEIFRDANVIRFAVNTPHH